MKALAVIFAALALAAPSPATRPQFSGMPPYRFMGDNVVITIYTADIEAFCGQPPEGYVILACHRRIRGVSHIVLPNPCLIPEEIFARIACHELGHSNGWSGKHEL